MQAMAGLCRLMLLAGFAALALRGGSVFAQPPAANAPAPAVCQKPDESLITSRGGYAGRMETPDDEKIKLYNAQARTFNDCMRKLIDSSSAEMDRIRDEGNAAIKAVAETANHQSIDIAEKMEAAIAGHTPSSLAQADPAGWQYPDADCAIPDKALMKAARGKKGTSAKATGKVDAQQQDYHACVQAYIKQAAAEMQQIEASANARINEIADRTNARISGLHDQVNSAIAIANHAATDEIQTVRGTPLEINPVNYFKDGLENVTVEGQPPLALADTPKGEGDPHTIVCRKPQQLPDSRLLGPEICKRNRVWAALYQAGKDISSDGQTILPSEKSRTINRASMACIKVPVLNGQEAYSGYFINEYCN
jgi:hypothetical protein